MSKNRNSRLTPEGRRTKSKSRTHSGTTLDNCDRVSIDNDDISVMQRLFVISCVLLSREPGQRWCTDVVSSVETTRICIVVDIAQQSTWHYVLPCGPAATSRERRPQSTTSTDIIAVQRLDACWRQLIIIIIIIIIYLFIFTLRRYIPEEFGEKNWKKTNK